ncbi:MAG: hypothetical protein M3Y88_07225 [Chloroflexota bacterium]|nr:hypothetical protein [Chloroflexota bacterium]
MTIEAARITAVVGHARHIAVAERERLAGLLAETAPPESLLLETCHRVELYTANGWHRDRATELLPAGARVLVGEQAVRHALGMAVGIDSVVLGEDQLLHQLRTSVAEAQRVDGLDPVLDRLFSIALRSGRLARSWRQGPPASLADVALSAIGRRVGSLSGRRVLVIGAGQMGRLAVRAAAAAGASVSVSSRSEAHAGELARQAGVESASMDPGRDAAGISGVIVALRGRWLISSATTDALVTGGAVVVDLSVPPAAPAELAERLADRFVSADALVAEAELGQPVHARLRALIDATLAEFADWLARRGGRATAAALAERAESQRSAELDVLWRRFPDLDPEVRIAIEAMSRHLAGRLLREPLDRLGHDADGRAEQAARDLFAI